MGLGYVVLSLVMGISLTIVLNIAAKAGNVVGRNGNVANLTDIFGLVVVPTAALVGLVVTTPVYLLFVNDKNAGVLEYLLAVGMSQTDIFWGYLKAAVMLSLVVMVPVILLNIAFATPGFTLVLLGAVLAFVTGISDVALVTVLMTAFSSLQRRPTGMNSPIGITIGIVLLMPEFLLISFLKGTIIWVEGAIAVAIFVIAIILLLSIQKLIKREKLLP